MPLEAALKGSKEISVTVLSMTLCLTAAFIPMLFMGGVVGKLFREFAITIITAVLISGFVSLSLTPMLCEPFRQTLRRDKKKPRMERFADQVNDRLKRIYKPCLHLGHEPPIHRCSASGSSASSFLSSSFVVYPERFSSPRRYRASSKGYTQARDGTSPFLMDKYHKEINEIAIEDPNIESIISISSYTNANEGILFLRLKPFKERQPMNDVINDLIDKIQTTSPASTSSSPLSPSSICKSGRPHKLSINIPSPASTGKPSTTMPRNSCA